MIDEHICDGDIALIENRTEAHDGEIGCSETCGRRSGDTKEIIPARCER